ncbi:MAG TPA: Rne/Rng family ribonuclease [Planctomycetota bacterium]|nr:Rne/Rng family ribonuclease [Planctomycetota bacterium]
MAGGEDVDAPGALKDQGAPAPAVAAGGDQSGQGRETAPLPAAVQPAPRRDGRSVPEKLVLMNVADPGEVRVAIMLGGRLDEIHLERAGRTLTGNIYRGTVSNVEPSLQAAFVDIGAGRNGFLHASDCLPPHGGNEEALSGGGRRRGGRGRARGEERAEGGAEGRGEGRGEGHPPIEKMLRKGQDVLVQVTKEGIGTKGPALTTYLSLPGRYLVLMPALSKLGVSKKIEDEAQREELRRTMAALKPPKDMGFIARTASVGHPAEDLARDMDFLVGLWKALIKRAQTAKAPALIYQESDLVIRAVRDFIPNDTRGIVIDSTEAAERVRSFLDLVCGELVDLVRLHEGPAPLFHHYGVEQELARLGRQRVKLPCGGSLVIEQTEALVAIDVNTGGFRGRERDQAGAILRTNLEAAREIAYQIRMRDIGGLVIIDFIDMDDRGHCRQVERELRAALERDRAKITVTPMSELGVIEMSRQRTRLGLDRSMYETCPACRGLGTVKSAESLGLDLLREVKAASGRGDCSGIEALFSPQVALAVTNLYRANLQRLEESAGVKIMIGADPAMGPGQMRVVLKGGWGTKTVERSSEEAD